MNNEFDMDSFGQDCPKNWEEIASYLNGLSEGLQDRDDINDIWEEYWSAYHSGNLPEDAPTPEIE